MNITEFKSKLPEGVSLIPILFQTPMVQAIGDNRKTKTRRTRGLEIINTNPDYWRFSNIPASDAPTQLFYFKHLFHEGDDFNLLVSCPYGNPGDILWVRETFMYSDDMQNPYWYFAQHQLDYTPEYLNRLKGYWKPSIHMPFEACRTFLRVKSIRPERLQDISERDAIVEGIERVIQEPFLFRWKNYTSGGEFHDSRDSFQTLWTSINGPESWDNNPWVWVIEFENVTKEEIFK